MASGASPLLQFLRALSPQQKKDFVSKCGTTYVYLHQLATQKRPNPALRLATSIVEESKKLSKRVMHPALTFEDLLFELGEPDEPEASEKPRKAKKP